MFDHLNTVAPSINFTLSIVTWRWASCLVSLKNRQFLSSFVRKRHFDGSLFFLKWTFYSSFFLKRTFSSSFFSKADFLLVFFPKTDLFLVFFFSKADFLLVFFRPMGISMYSTVWKWTCCSSFFRKRIFYSSFFLKRTFCSSFTFWKQTFCTS